MLQLWDVQQGGDEAAPQGLGEGNRAKANAPPFFTPYIAPSTGMKSI